MNSPVVTQISECFIKPKHISDESKQPVYLSLWDLFRLSRHYIQTGFLFRKNPNEPINPLLLKLKSSLSKTLNHFYTLAGQLSTIKKQNPDSCSVFIDCQKGPGARFVHKTVNITVEDIVSPKDVPLIVQSFFDHDGAVNHDGHFRPLLTVQVNELLDGGFLGCSINHAVVDGTSLWHFMNSWSEIFQSEKSEISRKPVHEHWFPNGYGPVIDLPFSDEKQFISKYESPILRKRFFHFSKESLYKLKNIANTELKSDQNYKISSFQALSALLWRCITRARFLPYDQVTSCALSINNRSRMEPKISENYFGNCIHAVRGIAKCGELLEHNLGWAALKLHEAVLNYTNESIRDLVDEWYKSPIVFQYEQNVDPYIVMMASSPRFDMYGNEFGLGKPLCIRSGYSGKFCGMVYSYPGCEGGGSIDVEVCLRPQVMSVFESDPEFMENASEQHVDGNVMI